MIYRKVPTISADVWSVILSASAYEFWPLCRSLSMVCKESRRGVQHVTQDVDPSYIRLEFDRNEVKRIFFPGPLADVYMDGLGTEFVDVRLLTVKFEVWLGSYEKAYRTMITHMNNHKIRYGKVCAARDKRVSTVNDWIARRGIKIHGKPVQIRDIVHCSDFKRAAQLAYLIVDKRKAWPVVSAEKVLCDFTVPKARSRYSVNTAKEALQCAINVYEYLVAQSNKPYNPAFAPRINDDETAEDTMIRQNRKFHIRDAMRCLGMDTKVWDYECCATFAQYEIRGIDAFAGSALGETIDAIVEHCANQ